MVANGALATVEVAYSEFQNFRRFFSAGIVIAAYGSGHIRIFSVAEACIVAEAAAHAGPFIAIANNFNQYNY